VHTGFWWGNIREKDHLEDPSADGRIILKWIYRNWVGGMDWIVRGDPVGSGTAVIEIFHRINFFGRTMALGSILPLNRNEYPGVKRPVRRADSLTTFMCQLCGNSGSLNLLSPPVMK